MEDNCQLRNNLKLQPSENVSFLSQIFFCWALPIFYRNHQKNSVGHYYSPLKTHRSDLLGNEFENAWSQQSALNVDQNLWLIIWKIFRFEFLGLGLLFIFSEFVLKMSQPWLIGRFINQYLSNSTEISKERCYPYGFMIILTSFSSAIATHFYQLQIQHLGMKIRIGCCSLIYRKTLKMNMLVNGNAGNIVNLLSNDANRLDLAPMHILQLFVAPVEAVFIICCLYTTVGPASISGIILLVLFIPLQMYLGKLTTVYRQKAAIKTDQRIKLIEEIFCGIQAIKIFTWERRFTEMVSTARWSEISQILKTSFIKAFNVSAMLFMNRVGIFLSILTYALTQKEINVEYVFVVSSFYAMLRQTLTVYLPFGIQNFSEAKVTIQRIKKFLLSDEISSKQVKKEISTYIFKKNEVHLVKCNSDDANMNKSEEQSAEVHFDNVSVKWLHSSARYVLLNANFKARANELVVITGSVGSGKSTLLLTILKELLPCEGQLIIKGRVSYAAQEPWLFSGTVRQNILFGSELEINKYKQIIQVCQLEKDLLTLRDGDATLVGDRGALLSGGQKARISLARALYRDADIYLLDDCLAAVDVKVAKKLFKECILGYLKEKCRILVTHNTHCFSGTINRIYVLHNGKLTLDLSHQQTVLVQNKDNNANKCASSAENTQTKTENDEKHLRTISKKSYQKYISSFGGYFTAIYVCFLFVFTQTAASGADYWAAYWLYTFNIQFSSALMPRRCRSSLLVEMDVKNQSSNTYLIIYGVIIFALIALSITRSLIFFYFCSKASINLHSQMLLRVIKAPMTFFQNTPAGNILNRFSKDIGSVDETLPSLLMDTLQVFCIILGSTLLVTLVNSWVLIPTAGICVVFYFFKIRYLIESRNMKRLEAEGKIIKERARSPIYTQLQTTIQGLITIRTYNVEKIFTEKFDRNQDAHSSAFYMFMIYSRAFGFWLDMICVFYTSLVIIITMLTDAPITEVGLSITQSINLIGVLQWGIRQWSELENQMVTIERVVEYTEVDQEKDSFDDSLPQSWPSNGEIKLKSVSLKYPNHLALDNVSCVIKPGEKVGIVGRTGSGKSSLISTLLRLFDTDGKILIDNIDIALVPLYNLRSRITVIPQQPPLFTGTLRSNLDPYHEFDDNKLWTVLEQMELKTAVMGFTHNLNTKVLQGGANFSAGEKQLICLARAFLKNSKIVIMDEATANIDTETDLSVQQKMRDKFPQATVLTIAHRLSTVLKSDRIIVMDDGKIIEFDRPDNLLHIPQSIFAQFHKDDLLAISE